MHFARRHWCRSSACVGLESPPSDSLARSQTASASLVAEADRVGSALQAPPAEARVGTMPTRCASGRLRASVRLSVTAALAFAALCATSHAQNIAATPNQDAIVEEQVREEM